MSMTVDNHVTVMLM